MRGATTLAAILTRPSLPPHRLPQLLLESAQNSPQQLCRSRRVTHRPPSCHTEETFPPKRLIWSTWRRWMSCLSAIQESFLKASVAWHHDLRSAFWRDAAGPQRRCVRFSVHLILRFSKVRCSSHLPSSGTFFPLTPWYHLGVLAHV